MATGVGINISFTLEYLQKEKEKNNNNNKERRRSIFLEHASVSRTINKNNMHFPMQLKELSIIQKLPELDAVLCVIDVLLQLQRKF